MPQPFTVHYVGSAEEVAHHAAPLAEAFPIELTAADRVASVASVGDVCLFFSEHFDRFRRAIGELRQRGVATLYALDGILEWRHAWENRVDEPACPWTMRPVLSHKVACIGQHQARILSDWGNGSKVEVVGLPRLDRWTTAHDSRPFGDEQPESGADTSSADELRVLVTTAKFPGFTPGQIETTTQSLRDMADWFQRNPRIDGKPLRVRWRLTRGLDRELGVQNALSDLAGQELQAQVRASDLVISTASTAMLESMLLRRPTVLLDYHSVPTYVPAAWTIRHPGDIEWIVRSAAGRDARRMSYQETILRDELECGSPALPRLVRLIESLHAASLAGTFRGGADGPGGGPGEDGAMPAASTLAHRVLAAWFPEYFAGRPAGDENPVELLAELAHARREIENLQRHIAQLSNELATAHDIFRQIHAHPIAGPIVRIRQRVLDSIQQWTSKRVANDRERL